MRRTLLLAAFAITAASAQQTVPVNYDESKVGAYTLPDPLVLADGTPVRDARTWNTRRRAELLRLFEDNIYGRSPARPSDQSFALFEVDRDALGGKAIRKQVTVYFSAQKDGPREDVLIYLPKSDQPVPVILSLNFSGNHTVTDDPRVRLAATWNRETKTRSVAAESSRGSARDFAGIVEQTIARGYGFATIYYGDIDPDFDGGWPFGVRKLFAKPGQTEPEGGDWGAIAAWGWGLSRALDYMETDADINAGRVAILGHSRQGKAVLWAGARDTRFAMVLANCSGEGGASLARRNYGETVKALNTRFPFWFARNHLKYGDHVDQLPVDSHELIALIAPRPVYLATAEDDRWADPRGEFLAATAAGAVYRLLGKRGLDAAEMPPLNQPIMSDIGFHYRTGKHQIAPFDWEQYLKFADMHLMLRPDNVTLPGRGLAQHPFLYCGEWQARGRTDQAMHIVRDGKVAWSYSIPGREELGDCTRLSNGNIVFSRRLSASEVTPDKKIVWHYDGPPGTEIHTTWPIGTDRVLIMRNGNPAKLLVIRKATNRVEKELTLPVRNPDGVHGQFRHARMTAAGTFLVAHLDLGKVVEYSAEGKELWSVAAPSAWAAVRLKNGNTLISGNQHGHVREVNRKGETVWEINKNDLPGFPLYTVQEVSRLANGNTLINNWAGSLPLGDWPKVVQLIEVTPEKKVVWALRDWKTLGSASSTQLLDERGLPEKGQLQR